MNQYNYDEKKADAAYRSFPDIEKWGKLEINLNKFSRNIKRLMKVSTVSPDILETAKRVVRRYAAVETGAVEKLYDVDRGFTWTVAVETAEINSLLSQKGKLAKDLIDSQLEAYDFILDLATGKRELTEAWIRELHEVLCKGQKTFTVHTSQGIQEIELRKGQYKKQPNHVIQANGEVHSYAPVDMVGPEMHRFLQIITSDEFNNIHTVIQAAYSHYCFVCIHPFSDGNGRVARALSSVFLYRAHSFPLLVLAEDRNEYFDSLEAADNGNYQIFVNFTTERCYNAIDIMVQSIDTSKWRDSQKSIADLEDLYKTKSGLTQDQIDDIANNLFNQFDSIVNDKYKKLQTSEYIKSSTVKGQSTRYNPISENHRLFIKTTGKMIRIHFSTKPPVEVNVITDIQIHIPKDCDENDDFIIYNVQQNKSITARLNEITPVIKPSLILKLELFANSALNETIERLLKKAQEIAKK